MIVAFEKGERKEWFEKAGERKEDLQTAEKNAALHLPAKFLVKIHCEQTKGAL